MYKDILLQILIVLFPLFLHFSLVKAKRPTEKQIKLLIGFYCSIVLILCLSFPVIIGSGGIFDLRLIPWFTSFLYGGPWVGLSVTFILFIYRFLLGGVGMYVVFITHSVLACFLILTSKNYINFSYKNKLKYASSLIIFHIIFDTALSLLIIPKISVSMSNLYFFIFLLIIYLTTLWLTVAIIDFMENNEKLHQELQRAEKMNLVGQLAASVAHEVRNPMTAIKGFLQLMSSDHTLSKNFKEYINISLEELDRANHIIQDYLSLAKPLEKYELVNIRKEIIQIKKTVSSYATFHNVTLNFEEGADLYVHCNRDKLKQVFINIIKNAIEATSSDNGVVNVRTYNQNNVIHIEIKDNGHGMTKEEIERLGLPFYTTKEKGTGLGMMICFKIVESMQGTISIESEKGSGTCFTVKLPEGLSLTTLKR